ncbi:MAG: UDP-N-acetylmuramate dehydrogenase [Lachnospiraceae bacterium]|nr:UDP-N-acetylmuramate dehydrogenase [Lachnospiraceae bacterium]
MTETVERFIRQLVAPEHLLQEEPMAKHTTFRVGGAADILIRIQGEEQLTKLAAYLGQLHQPYLVIGNGSNLLVSDRGYHGVVLQIGDGMNAVTVDGERMCVQAGALLSSVASQAAQHGLSGLEFAAGIPGSMGGAIVMNAGAYEGEMSQIVESVTVLNEQGERMVLDRDTMEFGYRTSIIRNRPFIVVETVLRLHKGDEQEIRARMEDFNAKRRAKQPLEYASAGSTFKRPEGYYAGKLIMDAGLRGYRIGGAQVSEKHCGFIINVGNASAQDIYELIAEVQEKVKQRFHVELEPEVIRIGDFL